MWSGEPQLPCSQQLRLHGLTSCILRLKTWDPMWTNPCHARDHCILKIPLVNMAETLQAHFTLEDQKNDHEWKSPRIPPWNNMDNVSWVVGICIKPTLEAHIQRPLDESQEPSHLAWAKQSRPKPFNLFGWQASKHRHTYICSWVVQGSTETCVAGICIKPTLKTHIQRPLDESQEPSQWHDHGPWLHVWSDPLIKGGGHLAWAKQSRPRSFNLFGWQTSKHKHTYICSWVVQGSTEICVAGICIKPTLKTHIQRPLDESQEPSQWHDHGPWLYVWSGPLIREDI